MPFEELERQLKHFWWEDEPELGRRFFSDFCDNKDMVKRIKDYFEIHSLVDHV